jgi:hypothetical protein
MEVGRQSGVQVTAKVNLYASLVASRRFSSLFLVCVLRGMIVKVVVLFGGTDVCGRSLYFFQFVV